MQQLSLYLADRNKIKLIKSFNKTDDQHVSLLLIAKCNEMDA